MPHHKPLARLILPTVLLTLLLVGMVGAAGETISRAGLSAGGGAQIGASFQLRSSVGQPAAGGGGDTIRLCSGLICGAAQEPPQAPGERVYLPLLLR